MRILLLNQFFWPDSAATSQLLTDVARALADEGHDVHAICASSTYAAADSEGAPDVTMHRVKAFAFARGRVGRILSYASFYVGAAWQGLRVARPDVVLTLTTPPLLSLLGNLIKRMRGSKHFIWEMDVYPDVAVDLGYIKAGSLLEDLLRRLANWSRRQSDGVIALGECMKERLVAQGIPAAQITVASNWADSRSITVLPHGASQGTLRVLYSGNLGLAHDLDTITGAIANLRQDERFRFLFVGSGSRRAQLASFVDAEQIRSVELRSYVPRSDLSESLAVGDIGLVTQRSDCCGSVVPSKVYGLLAAGRPILFIGPSEATPARVIREFDCGWHIPCGDVAALTKLLSTLVTDPGEVRSRGERGRQALIDHYDRPHGTARIIAILTGSAHSAADERTVSRLTALPEIELRRYGARKP